MARRERKAPDAGSEIDADVIVVGAGMVGSALAALLADTSLSVVLLDAGDGSTGREDVRVSALTRATQAMLDHLDVWDIVSRGRPGMIEAMRVWDGSGDRSFENEIHFDAAELGEPCLGWIVPNGLTLTALQQALAQQSRVRILTNATLQDFRITRDRIGVELVDGRRLHARLLVGADGARSRVREIWGVENRGWQFRQTAIVAEVKTTQSHDNTAWQCFLPTGPLAFLPLAEPHHSSIVWSCDEAEAGAIAGLSDEDFAIALANAAGQRLGKVVHVGPRNRFPLTYAHARHYVAPRLALIGDAAHRVHPLAGQGVNMGFLDAAALAEVLATAEDRRGRAIDPGDISLLQRYERWRQAQNRLMLDVSDGFKRVFGARHPLLQQLRGAGLKLGNNIVPLKHTLMRIASGLNGDLPQSVRPWHR